VKGILIRSFIATMAHRRRGMTLLERFTVALASSLAVMTRCNADRLDVEQRSIDEDSVYESYTCYRKLCIAAKSF
jgi:hypothetical protein